jgi:predicted flavoprotein YhiN
MDAKADGLLPDSSACLDDADILDVAVIGGGPAGLMAAGGAERPRGLSVAVFERMPTLGRKFLMAGRGGLNLTHSEDFERFAGATARRASACGRCWRPSRPPTWWPGPKGLGQATFVGTSGRVFPKALKASPLLRAWIARLEAQGVALNLRSTWTGWNAAGDLTFETADGPRGAAARHDPGPGRGQLGQARLGRRLGAAAGRRAARRSRRSGRPMSVSPWPGAPVFRERFAGAPLKNVALRFGGQARAATPWSRATAWRAGRSTRCRRPCATRSRREARARLEIDLRPDVSPAQLTARLSKPRGRAVAVELAAQGRPPVAGRDRPAARGPRRWPCRSRPTPWRRRSRPRRSC